MSNKSILTGLFMFIVVSGDLIAQRTTFGDLIPARYLPSAIRPSEPLDCNRYFRLADSINQLVFALTGKNPIPEYHCGNDSLSYIRGSLEETLKELSTGSILARMVIDRAGSPVCCKVYMKGESDAPKHVEDALRKLVMLPSYRNGVAIPTECRFIYDFFNPPKTVTRRVID